MSKAEDVLTELENEVSRDTFLRVTQHRSGRSPKSAHALALKQLYYLCVAALPKKAPKSRGMQHERNMAFNYGIDECTKVLARIFGQEEA